MSYLNVITFTFWFNGNFFFFRLVELLCNLSTHLQSTAEMPQAYLGWKSLAYRLNRSLTHFTCHLPSALQSKENDEAAQLPITDESPAIEVVNEAATTKATPEDMQGAVQEKSAHCSSFIFNLLHFNILFSPLFKQGQSLRQADVHVSQL